MEGNNRTNFSYLNRDGEWPGFHRSGLELLNDGALRLHSVPLFDGDLPDELHDAPDPSGPAGIAAAPDGSIFYSDPAGNRIIRIDGCDGSTDVVRCIARETGSPVGLKTPRGLLIPKYRPSLFVADSGNSRIQVFDLDTFQLVDVWGQTDKAHGVSPNAGPGRFDTPWALDADDKGAIYVVDWGNARVRKFNRAGTLVPSFWDTMKQAGLLEKPSGISVASKAGHTRLYVLDESKLCIFVFDQDGNPVSDSGGNPISFGTGLLSKPMGLAASDDAVYVGDNQRRRILVFKHEDDYGFAGEAVGYQGPIAALALDGKGHLLVHSGLDVAPFSLAIDEGFQNKGALWSGPIRVRELPVRWHRLQALMSRTGSGARLRLFVHTADDQTDQPVVNFAADDPFADLRWRPASSEPFTNLDDLYIGGDAATYVWVGALFSSDGVSTAVLSQLRVEFDHETYLKHLPAIYGEPSPCGDFLTRFLSLFETFFDGTERTIAEIARFFDPAVIPSEFLSWLAGWLALELDEDWDEARKRELIAEAFQIYGRRGTARGLREALRLYAGVDAIIEEPIRYAQWWALPRESASCECSDGSQASNEPKWEGTENSILGVSTSLAGAEPQGAVVGSTAILDQSYLISSEEYGSPLFVDLADRFTVQIYRGQLSCPETLARVHDVIRREKPAHTDYHLCVIEPRLRAGYQARVGIDTVVSGPPLPSALDEASEIVLGGQPAGRAGSGNMIGITARVG